MTITDAHTALLAAVKAFDATPSNVTGLELSKAASRYASVANVSTADVLHALANE